MQFLGNGDAVDLLAALVQLLMRAKMRRCFSSAKSSCTICAGDFDEARVVQKNGAEDEAFRIDVCGKTFFKSDLIEGGGTERHGCGSQGNGRRLWIATGKMA